MCVLIVFSVLTLHDISRFNADFSCEFTNENYLFINSREINIFQVNH